MITTKRSSWITTKRSSCVNGLAMSLALLAGAAVLASVLSACAATTQGQVALQQQTPTGQTDPTGAAQFLGSDAALLQPGAEGQAAYVYINPNVQWSNYKKVMLKPVEFWDSPDTSVSPDDQKMLTSYFYNSLQTNVQKNFTIVDQPGPGVITFAVAIINATGATPGLRSVSLVIPQARILNYAQSLATGHAAFAGSAEAAFKATDSSSGTLLEVGGQAHRRDGRGQCGADPVGRRRGRDGLLGAAYHTARGRARGGHSCSHRPTFGEQLALHRFSVGATPKTRSAFGVAGRRHDVERRYSRPLVKRRIAAAKGDYLRDLL